MKGKDWRQGTDVLCVLNITGSLWAFTENSYFRILSISRCATKSRLVAGRKSFLGPGAGFWKWELVQDSTCRSIPTGRSEEHTSELQSQSNLVCRLLLEKKKQH